MLPQLKHRLIIGLSIVLGGLCWLFALGALTPADGSTGLSLMDASAGTPSAVLIVIATGIPAIIAGLVVASTGNPLTGVFTVSGSLLLLSAMGGSIDGYLRRAELPADFKTLAIESAIWLVLLAVIFVVIDRLRTSVRPSLQKLAAKHHLGTRTKLTFPGVKPLLAGLITTAGGAFFCNLLIQSSDGGQVNGALILGFGVAALIGNMTIPQRNPLVILLSPMIVSAGAYLWIAQSYTTTDTLLFDLYTHNFLNLALALPIQYASAGVCGCALGVGLAQSLEHVRHTTAITA
jgi:hypothetical protein